MQVLNIARLKERVEFFEAGVTEDEMGQTVTEYKPYKKMWAEVIADTGKETEDADKLQNETNYKVRIRYTKGITPDMMIFWKDKWLEITSIVNVYERDRVLLMQCVEYFHKRVKEDE